MKPILFPPAATAFESLGHGVLSETTSCLVTEERNGVFELTLVYPQSGRLFSKLINRSILYCPVDASGRKEPFRVYKITKPKSGLVTVYAAHLSYDLSGVVLSPFSASNAPEAMAAIRESSSTNNPFTFWTDKDTVASFKVNVPSSVRSIMGGSQGSLLDVYGGEYSYERYTVKLHAKRGENRGVTIRYGKNLVDLKQEENIQNVYTGVYPFWITEDSYVELPEKILCAEGDYGFTKIRPLDASLEFEEPPTEEALRSYAQRFMENNNIGVPSVSISVSFVPLEQSEEYKNIAPLQQVLLCDTVSVKFEQLGIDATAKCIKTVYDVLKQRYERIELGEARANIADTIAGQAQDLKRVQDPSYVQSAVSSAAATITGNRGGYVVLHSSTESPQPDEILIMDTPSTTTATNVWRWNKAGLGFSSTGYNGEYKLAMTIDGKFVADFISTGTLDAADIIVKNLQADRVLSSGETPSGVSRSMQIEDSFLLLHSAGVERLSIMITGVENEPRISFQTEDSTVRTAIEQEQIMTPYIDPTPGGSMSWQYIGAIGKTVLVKT